MLKTLSSFNRPTRYVLGTNLGSVGAFIGMIGSFSPALASVMLPAVLVPAVKILVLSFAGHALLWFRLVIPGTGRPIAWRELTAPLFAAISSLGAVSALVIYLRSPFIDSPNREDLAPDFGLTVAVAAIALAIWFVGLIVAVRQERVRPVL